jgi:hypothetical protein
MKDTKLLFKQVLGLALIVVGLLIIYFVLPIAFSRGLFTSWIMIWPIVTILGSGSFLLLDVDLKSSVKTIAIACVIMAPWTLIFYISLPGDAQNLLAVLILGVGSLLYLRYYRKTSKDQ